MKKKNRTNIIKHKKKQETTIKKIINIIKKQEKNKNK